MNEQQIIQILTEKFNGNLWEKHGHRRIYFDASIVASLGGMDWSNYKSGNISSASYDGEKISNSEARRILQALHTFNFKLWYDINDGKFYSKGEIRNSYATEIKARFLAAAQQAIG